MLKTKSTEIIDVNEWDALVTQEYGKPYSFQQQDGCQDRGLVYFSVPDTASDFEKDTIPEKINGEEMGVSFKAWLEKPAGSSPSIFWERNFYPDIQMIANDLHKKGLLESGDYAIQIDW